MNILTLTRSIRLVAGAGTCLWASMTLAQTAAPEQALRELDIMSNIFQASMKSSNNRRFNSGQPQTLYLAGQGMVFTFNLSGGGYWPPGVNMFNGGDFNFNFDFNYDNDDDSDVRIQVPQVPQAPQANGAAKAGSGDKSNAENYRRRMQELSERIRDKQEEMRDLQHKQRDLQRAQRSDSSKSNATEMDKLSKSMEALGTEISALGNNITQVQKEAESERNAAAEAQHKQQTALIFDTLCKYGNTLQSLKAGEHVNVVLHNYAGNKTMVYVLDHDKLTGCKSPDALLKAANSYAMESP